MTVWEGQVQRIKHGNINDSLNALINVLDSRRTERHQPKVLMKKRKTTKKQNLKKK